jgi:hypothetical protein
MTAIRDKWGCALGSELDTRWLRMLRNDSLFPGRGWWFVTLLTKALWEMGSRWGWTWVMSYMLYTLLKKKEPSWEHCPRYG